MTNYIISFLYDRKWPNREYINRETVIRWQLSPPSGYHAAINYYICEKRNLLQQDREKVLLLAVCKLVLTRALGESYFFQSASFGTSTLRNSNFLIGILVVLYCAFEG